jgi:type IV pilus assembly protein PilC
MPIFKYEAQTEDGTIIKKAMESTSYADAYATLVDKGLAPIKIEPIEKEKHGNKIDKMKLRDVTIFCRQFSTMIGAGMSIIKIFDMLRKQETSSKQRYLIAIYEEVYRQVNAGMSLSEAVGSMQDVFPAILINMIRAGEVSGNLDSVMEKTAAYFASRNKLMNKIKTGMVYPKILVAMIVIIVLAMFTFILPEFFKMFEILEIDLPGITLLLIGISNFITTKWYIIIIAVLVVIGAYRAALLNPTFVYNLDVFKTKIPIVKVMTQKTAIANFTNTMGVLYSSGVSMMESIEISAAVLENKYYEDQLSDVVKDVENGKMFSLSLEERDIFEPMVTALLFSGEESGNLDTILAETAEFYSNEAEEATARMVATMEPIMIIVIGVIVGFIVAAVLLPTFSLASGLSNKSY